MTFDYGGTLDGEASHWLDRFVALYAEVGIRLPFTRVKEAFYCADEAAYTDPRVASMGLAELMKFHVAAQFRVLGIEETALQILLVERFVTRSREALARSRRVLQRLKQRGLRLGVISNFYGNVARILAEEGFGPLLSVVVDSGALGIAKPEKRIFDVAVQALGATADAVLHVGDSYERDVVAARAAGLRAAWLTAAENSLPSPDAAGADLCVRSLEELVAWLNGKEQRA